jgi:hypothetical protein
MLSHFRKKILPQEVLLIFTSHAQKKGSYELNAKASQKRLLTDGSPDTDEEPAPEHVISAK